MSCRARSCTPASRRGRSAAPNAASSSTSCCASCGACRAPARHTWPSVDPLPPRGRTLHSTLPPFRSPRLEPFDVEDEPRAPWDRGRPTAGLRQENMKSFQPSTRPPARPRPALLAQLAVVALAAALGAGQAHAHIDWAKESGVVQLDSATAVASGATPLSWRSASPLTVPDRFGPGAVLSVGNVRMKVVND